MKSYTFKEHFLELKARFLRVFAAFIIGFIICYYFSSDIYNILLEPLAELSHANIRRVIYTGLTEAFFTYIKLAAFVSFIMIIPIISIECFLFIKPGLYSHEKKYAAFILFMAPILFWCGGVFVFYFVMPRAWQFFLSFEDHNVVIPLILEARVSEYLNLVIQLIIAFGIAFQLPIIMLILNLLKILTAKDLVNKRRWSIIIIFVIAGILTPPDVLSQFALAIPMLLLYETSVIMCKFVENRGN
ncbi:preprotein translocase subunit TatC [Rickettsia endosymbiont of Culicoides newsteadi]|nr:preprotein translocase subunit TatC [Rickettsia endosymbiont of Culicoides newsteadi]